MTDRSRYRCGRASLPIQICSELQIFQALHIPCRSELARESGRSVNFSAE